MIAAIVPQFLSADMARTLALVDRPWGLTEFVVKDCDGHLLCFGQDIADAEAS